ncbi:MAG: YbgC/FadM family acyl-CoA thioesterase [Shewanellaceae bacterium]|nr:YbgC/FadM family acyl-CoA thioesterase [Shewanellaceae bacterium]
MIFHKKIRIYYEDTDASGIVYHANYLKFFERARTDAFHQTGLTHQALTGMNMAFVIKHLAVDYRAPAYLEQFLEIETVVAQVKRASVLFEQSLKDVNILCKQTTKIALIDLTTKQPLPIPSTWVQKIQAVGVSCAQ